MVRQVAEVENARRGRIGRKTIDFLAVTFERYDFGKAQCGARVLARTARLRSRNVGSNRSSAPAHTR